MNGSVTIVNHNANAHNIVSAAGRISTTEGSADEIYHRSCGNEEEKNIRLINKILSSGHESVLEHISVNLSFDNVSVFVEQFMIEFRLASFTVKSRRYVNFGRMGYIVPDFSKYAEENREFIQNTYKNHMNYLFDEYNYFVESGIPKEDARFVLPYSFRSNFYCTVNARELVKIMNEMVFGRGKDFPELVLLGKSLFSQCEEKLPYLNVEKSPADIRGAIRECFRGEVGAKAGCSGFSESSFQVSEDSEVSRDSEVSKGAGGSEVYQADSGFGISKKLVELISGTEFPEEVICKAAALNYGLSEWKNMEVKDEETQRKIISILLENTRKRELEQANFTILFNRISLAGVTHLVRHRMQSIVVPELAAACDFNEYILPESIVNAGLQDRYEAVFSRSSEIAGILAEKGFLNRDSVYLLLSGLTVQIMTTMNGNELYVFMRLRTCNRAQWEIKACADALLGVLRERNPVLFSMFGPSCYVTGRCPEGKMTCGHMEEVIKKYNFSSEG